MYCLVQFKYTNYNLNGHTGCYYYCMIEDTCTVINYHLQYLILDAQRRSENIN